MQAYEVLESVWFVATITVQLSSVMIYALHDSQYYVTAHGEIILLKLFTLQNMYETKNICRRLGVNL